VIRAACHCGAVRFEIAEAPEWVLDCNCTICRRYGALWTYFHGQEGQAKLVTKPDPEATETYIWGERYIAFHRCKACGCVTHFVAVSGDPPGVVAVNARMMAGLDPAKTRIRRIDNSHSGFFWTREDEPPMPSRHPPMPPPRPEDWR
jgi:hypothetical protein